MRIRSFALTLSRPPPVQFYSANSYISRLAKPVVSPAPLTTKEYSPLTEELRILVGAGGLGFFAGADKNAEGVGGDGLEGAGTEGEKEGN